VIDENETTHRACRLFATRVTNGKGAPLVDTYTESMRRNSMTLVYLHSALCVSLLRGADPAPLGQMVDLGGRRLHLNCTGVGSPAVIVENGGGGFSVEWALVQPEVAKHTRICTYDCAGYAWSDRGPIDDGIEQIVGDLNLLLRTAHVTPPFVLVGQSLGCPYARAYQRRFPEQIAGLVFVDGTHDEDIRMVVNGKRVPLSLLSRDQLPAAHQEYLNSVPALNPGRAGAPPFDRLPPTLQQVRQWAFGKAVRDFGWLPNTLAAAESWRQEFSALRRQRLSGRYPLANLPLRVLERQRDSTEIWHLQQVQLAALSSEGRLTKADRSGHMIHIERPDLVVEAIVDLVQEIRRGK
jgi:pimeloyl-ACP methyl ester carboxylesterase